MTVLSSRTPACAGRRHSSTQRSWAVCRESNGSTGRRGGGYTCAGTSLQSPGVLAGGSYASVVVKGYCVVNAGVAVVRGDLTVRPGGVLAAAFALNDRTGQGKSELIVRDDLTIGRGPWRFSAAMHRSSPASMTRTR